MNNSGSQLYGHGMSSYMYGDAMNIYIQGGRAQVFQALLPNT